MHQQKLAKAIDSVHDMKPTLLTETDPITVASAVLSRLYLLATASGRDKHDEVITGSSWADEFSVPIGE